ncbi:MAG: hypothetical protein KAR06_12045 [Deltaproteobacteria bacterium]|nr:hypothetical protein [Deltaproteobacteria bacterium]
MSKGNVALFSLVVLLAVTGLASCSKVDPETLKGGETRQTLNPVYFTGEAQKAYEAARNLPEVIDSLQCYCNCTESVDNRSLLSCFVDMSARYCKTCMEAALLAKEMNDGGKDVVEIRKTIDKKFSVGGQ